MLVPSCSPLELMEVVSRYTVSWGVVVSSILMGWTYRDEPSTKDEDSHGSDWDRPRAADRCDDDMVTVEETPANTDFAKLYLARETTNTLVKGHYK